jgi:hypothetical protein
MTFEEKLEQYKIGKMKSAEFIYATDVVCVDISKEQAKEFIPEYEWEKFRLNILAGHKVEFAYQVDMDRDYGYDDCNCSLEKNIIVTVTRPKLQLELEKEVEEHEEVLNETKRRKADAAQGAKQRKKKEKEAELVLLAKLAAKHGKTIT